MERQKIVVLAGPTASGKSSHALAVAEKLGAHILCADSMTVYRGMDIGTSKPTREDRARVPHHFLDVVNPDEAFTAADFSTQGRAILSELKEKGIPALVVGGTGLYIRALIHGLFEGPPAHPHLRAELLAEEGKDPGYIHRRLEPLDPAAAARLHPRDLVRVIRALEVVLTTGQPLSRWIEAHQFQDRPFDVLFLCLEMPREELYRRVDARVEDMMAQGLVREVKGLLARGYTPGLKPMMGLGYLHMCRHLVEGMDLREAVRTLQRDTRHFARRQLTWMRSEEGVVYHPASEGDALHTAIITHLNGGRDHVR